MSNKNLRERLEAMVDKMFAYGNQFHYVKKIRVDEDGEKFFITTQIGEYERSVESAKEFLGYWQLVDNVKDFNVPAAQNGNGNGNGKELSVFVENQNSDADKLIQTLHDNIEKVKADAGYIKQAQAINNNVNSIININKLKLDFMKLKSRK